MSGSVGEAAFKLAFVISPIVFVGGRAQNIPGGVLPIGLATGAFSLVSGLLSGGSAQSLDSIYPQFQPIAGSTLIDFEIAKFPFANQNVAANATIAQPLTLSMRMYWPAQPQNGGYASKIIGMMALQVAVAQHGASGGTYTVITPAHFYTNMILKTIRDITSGPGEQAQVVYQWDFEQPLLTLNAAQSVQSSLMQKLTSGSPIDGQPAWSSPSNVVGSANSAQAPGFVPTTGGAPAAITSPFIPNNF